MISFIIPTYNSQSTIIKCLESIVIQNIADYEIIVIDDGSKDETINIVTSYKEKNQYDFIKVLCKENGGAGSARNMGLKYATKDYIQFVDSDDSLCKEYYSVLKEHLLSKKIDIIYYDYEMEIEKTKIKMINYYSSKINDSQNFIIKAISPCLFVAKKSLYDKINFKFTEGIIYEDYACIAHLGVSATNVKYIGKVLYTYYVNNISVMRNINNSLNQNFLDIIPATQNLMPLLNTEYQEEVLFLIIRNLLSSSYLRIFKSAASYKSKKIFYNQIRDFYKSNFEKPSMNVYVKSESFVKRCYYSFIYYNDISILNNVVSTLLSWRETLVNN